MNLFITGPGEVPRLENLETDVTKGFGAPATVTVKHAPTTVVTSQAADDSRLASRFVAAEVRVFSPRQRDTAVQWVEGTG